MMAETQRRESPADTNPVGEGGGRIAFAVWEEGKYAVLQRPCHLHALAETIRELLAGAQHTSLTLS